MTAAGRRWQPQGLGGLGCAAWLLLASTSCGVLQEESPAEPTVPTPNFVRAEPKFTVPFSDQGESPSVPDLAALRSPTINQSGAEELDSDAEAPPQSLPRPVPEPALVSPGPGAEATSAPQKVSASTTEELFHQNHEKLKSLLAELDPGKKLHDYAELEKADIEKRLIALFFLRTERNLEDYRELLESLSRTRSPVLSLEILKAAFFQELGMTELRNGTLQNLVSSWKQPTPLGQFAIQNLSFARRYEGYRKVTRHDPAVLRRGQETLIYGEFEGFQSVEVPLPTGNAPGYRRSFTAFISLRDHRGSVIERRPLLIAGKATETVASSSDPVHFTGRFNVPLTLESGSYYLDVFAVDVEAEATAKATIPFRVE